MSDKWWAMAFSPMGWIMAAVVFGGIAGIVAMFVNAWKSNRESERIAVLKQQMLDKGMTADEIARVIEAGRPKEEC